MIWEAKLKNITVNGSTNKLDLAWEKGWESYEYAYNYKTSNYIPYLGITYTEYKPPHTAYYIEKKALRIDLNEKCRYRVDINTMHGVICLNDMLRQMQLIGVENYRDDIHFDILGLGDAQNQFMDITSSAEGTSIHDIKYIDTLHIKFMNEVVDMFIQA